MKITKTFVKAVLAVLESNNAAWGAEIECQGGDIWNLTFENSNSIKIEIYLSEEENLCIINAYNCENCCKWFCTMKTEKITRDYFFYHLHDVMHTIDDEICKENDRIWEQRTALENLGII